MNVLQTFYFTVPTARFCSANLRRLLGVCESPICCKCPEFLKPSNAVYFEFLRHFRHSDILILKRAMRPVNHFTLHPFIHRHIYTHTHAHVHPLRWIPDLEFNAFLFRITSQECGTRATSLITPSWWMWGCLKGKDDDGIQTFLGVGVHPVQYLTLLTGHVVAEKQC